MRTQILSFKSLLLGGRGISLSQDLRKKFAHAGKIFDVTKLLMVPVAGIGLLTVGVTS